MRVSASGVLSFSMRVYTDGVRHDGYADGGPQTMSCIGSDPSNEFLMEVRFFLSMHGCRDSGPLKLDHLGC